MEEISQVVKRAIKMETDGIEFYRKAGGKTSHPFGKEMFLSFMKEEQRHLNVLKEILADLDFSGVEEYFRQAPREKIKTIFSRLKDEMRQRIAANPDELEVLRIGMKMEEESVSFYGDALKKSTDPRAKALLERLILEERDHHRILENTYSLLENSGEWFLWDERALLNGG